MNDEDETQEETHRPGWGHPIMFLVYALCMVVGGLFLWWLL